MGLTSLSAQTVNDIPVKDINVEYIQIVGTPKGGLSNKQRIVLDFGTSNKLISSEQVRTIRDSSGKTVVFDSMIDALNFMTSNGYDFVQAYTTSLSNNQHAYHYLLRKKK
jgi:hypothetical protein